MKSTDNVLSGLTKKIVYGDGEHVYYVPANRRNEKHEFLEIKNMGVVSSSNEMFVFVKYAGSESSQATQAMDLYSFESDRELVEKFDNEYLKPKT